MLWAKLHEDGNLVIQASETIEAYALKQWEKQRASGKAQISIETGQLFDMESLVKSLGKDIAEFRKWVAKRDNSAILQEDVCQVVLSTKNTGRDSVS